MMLSGILFSEIFVFGCRSTLLSLSLDKIGCGSAKNLKQVWLFCSHLSLSLCKIERRITIPWAAKLSTYYKRYTQNIPHEKTSVHIALPSFHRPRVVGTGQRAVPHTLFRFRLAHHTSTGRRQSAGSTYNHAGRGQPHSHIVRPSGRRCNLSAIQHYTL